MVVLNVKASTEFSKTVMDFVNVELDRNDFPAKLQPEILIAVEEIFVNIAKYAYKPAQEGNVKLSVAIGEKAVIQFEDTGVPFNPLASSEPDLSVPIMERKIGGLGIHFVKNMMDEVEYRHTDGKNIITITKGLIG